MFWKILSLWGNASIQNFAKWYKNVCKASMGTTNHRYKSVKDLLNWGY